MSVSREREALFERYFEQVYAYVAYRTSPDRAAAEDITQEVFLAAFGAGSAYRSEASALGWLRGIARNKVADHYRSREARRSPETLLAEPGLAAVDNPHEAQHRALLVAQVLRQLPDHYAQILEEKYLEGLAVKAIAQNRKMSEKAVESALTRARESFRQMYQQLQAIDPCEETHP